MPEKPLLEKMIGLPIGEHVKAHPANAASLIIETTYDANKTIIGAIMKIEIPLSHTASSIISPVKADGTQGKITDGDVGLNASIDIFDNRAGTGNKEIVSYVCVHDADKGFLHLQVPIVMAVKTRQIN